jgi:hypothetical protein
VAQFVDRFLQKPIAEERRIGRKSVKFLAQSKGRHHRAISLQLSFAEHKGQDWNV